MFNIFYFILFYIFRKTNVFISFASLNCLHYNKGLVQNYCNYLISCYKFSIWICYKNEFTFESLSNLNKTSRLTSNLNHTKTHVLRVRKCSSIPDMSFVKKPNTIYFYIKRYTIFNKSTMNSSYIFIYTSDICDRKKKFTARLFPFSLL